MKKHRWIDDITGPCDPEIFMSAMAAYHQGVNQPVPPPNSGPGFYLTDIPLNRAGLAGVKHLRDAGVTNPQAYLWRIFHFGEIVHAAEVHGLGEHVRGDEVSGALIRAAAVATLTSPPINGKPVFDMVDVAAKAAEFKAIEEAEDGKVATA